MKCAADRHGDHCHQNYGFAMAYGAGEVPLHIGSARSLFPWCSDEDVAFISCMTEIL